MNDINMGKLIEGFEELYRQYKTEDMTPAEIINQIEVAILLIEASK